MYFSESEIKWKTCVEHFQMMPDPHSDAGAEDFFTVSKKHVSNVNVVDHELVCFCVCEFFSRVISKSKAQLI